MGENNSVEISASISWTNRLEEYFASTGEKASGLAWVHKRSEAIYSNRRTYIDLPVIIGSGVIAFLNAGSSTLFDDPKISSVALGVGSLAMGILNSFGSYFGWAKRAEGHRISAIHYAKLYRFITVELSLPRHERMSPHDLLKYVKDQYDRLSEISPMVPDIIINEFKRKFKDQKDISKPEETNGLHKISIYKDVEDDQSMSEMPKFNTPKMSGMKDIFSKFSTKSPISSIPEELKEEAKKMITNPMIAVNELKKQIKTEEEKPVATSSDITIEIPKSD